MVAIRPTVAADGATGSEDQTEKIYQNMPPILKRKFSKKTMPI
jgi:hypothetical protein